MRGGGRDKKVYSVQRTVYSVPYMRDIQKHRRRDKKENERELFYCKIKEREKEREKER